MTLRPLGLALCAALFAAPLAAQNAVEAAHQRVAGCYAIEPTSDAPWLLNVESAVRLTLEPVLNEMGVVDPSASPQYLVRPARGERSQPIRYTFLAWSLFGDGEIVSIVWSSPQDQVALTFVPEPLRPGAVSIGSTTWFQHEKMTTTEPVDVKVTAVRC